jgi:hypothetical protein
MLGFHAVNIVGQNSAVEGHVALCNNGEYEHFSRGKSELEGAWNNTCNMRNAALAGMGIISTQDRDIEPRKLK